LRNVLERSLLRTEEESRWLALDLSWLNRGPSGRTTSQANPQDPAASQTKREGLSPLEAEEYRLINDAMRETQGGIRRAAAKLGLSPQALLRRLEKWPELRNGKQTT